MRGETAVILAALLALCAPVQAVTIRVDRDSVTLGRDTNIVKTIRITQDDSGSGHGSAHGNALSNVPPEAWAKLTPEQTQELIQQSIVFQPKPPKPSDAPVEVVVPIAFFSAVVLALFFWLRWRMKQSQFVHEQRLAMIAQGIVPPDMSTQPKPAAPRVQKMIVWGWIMALGGVGLSIANVLEDGISEIGWGLVFALVGVGLLMAARYIGGQPVTGPKEGDVPPSQDSGTT
jgi:hypothetical protein